MLQLFGDDTRSGDRVYFEHTISVPLSIVGLLRKNHVKPTIRLHTEPANVVETVNKLFVFSVYFVVPTLEVCMRLVALEF